MRVLIFTIWSLFQLSAYSQESLRTINFRTVGLETGKIPLLLAGDAQASKLIDCKIHRKKISDPVQISVPNGEIIFFLKEPEEGVPPQIAARCVVPKTITQPLLLFLPKSGAKKGDPPMSIKVLDGSEKSFPRGGALVVNLYSDEVRFFVGEHLTRQLAAGKSVSLPMPEKRDAHNMTQIKFQFKGSAGWRTARESRLRFTEAARRLLITYIDPKSKEPSLQMYRDITKQY